MNAISLFSGIGGLDLAISGVARTQLYVEIDPVCQAILRKRMSDGALPTAPIHPDVTTLDAVALRGLIGDTPISILSGGFPCEQGFL